MNIVESTIFFEKERDRKFFGQRKASLWGGCNTSQWPTGHSIPVPESGPVGEWGPWIGTDRKLEWKWAAELTNEPRFKGQILNSMEMQGTKIWRVKSVKQQRAKKKIFPEQKLGIKWKFYLLCALTNKMLIVEAWKCKGKLRGKSRETNRKIVEKKHAIKPAPFFSSLSVIVQFMRFAKDRREKKEEKWHFKGIHFFFKKKKRAMEIPDIVLFIFVFTEVLSGRKGRQGKKTGTISLWFSMLILLLFIPGICLILRVWT